MTKLKKLAVAVALSAASIGAQAEVQTSALTDVRDNLMNMYNETLTGSWGVDSDYDAGADALLQLTKYATTSFELTFEYDSDTESDTYGEFLISYETDADDWNTGQWNDYVEDLEDGVFMDFFGKTDLTNIITSETNPDAGSDYIVSITANLGTGAMLNDDDLTNTFDDAISDLNTGLNEWDKTKIDNAIDLLAKGDGTGLFDDFNDHNPDFVSDISDMTGATADDAFDYGFGWDSSSGCYVTKEGSNVVHYDSYADYANGVEETDDNCKN